MAQILFSLKEHWAEKLSALDLSMTPDALRANKLGAVRGSIIEVQADGYFQTRQTPNPPSRGWGGGKMAGNQGLILIYGETADIKKTCDELCYGDFTSWVQDAKGLRQKRFAGSGLRTRYLIDISKLPQQDVWVGETVSKKSFQRYIYTVKYTELKTILIDRSV